MFYARLCPESDIRFVSSSSFLFINALVLYISFSLPHFLSLPLFSSLPHFLTSSLFLISFLSSFLFLSSPHFFPHFLTSLRLLSSLHRLDACRYGIVIRGAAAFVAPETYLLRCGLSLLLCGILARRPIAVGQHGVAAYGK